MSCRDAFGRTTPLYFEEEKMFECRCNLHSVGVSLQERCASEKLTIHIANSPLSLKRGLGEWINESQPSWGHCDYQGSDNYPSLVCKTVSPLGDSKLQHRKCLFTRSKAGLHSRKSIFFRPGRVSIKRNQPPSPHLTFVAYQDFGRYPAGRAFGSTHLPVHRPIQRRGTLPLSLTLNFNHQSIAKVTFAISRTFFNSFRTVHSPSPSPTLYY